MTENEMVGWHHRLNGHLAQSPSSAHRPAAPGQLPHLRARTRLPPATEKVAILERKKVAPDSRTRASSVTSHSAASAT